jgi:iron complex outermembrane receptor protein
MIRTGPFTQPFLRGVGKRSTLGVENGVATYVDGIYLASSISALLDLRGIERIEVLNGPQGTLFGRNATGGVIQIVTRDPEAEPSGELIAHAGSHGHVRGDAYLTGGGDRIAGNVAVSVARNHGYGTNVFTGKSDIGEVDHRLAARSKWIWRPPGSLKLTLAADYQDVDHDFTQLPLAGFPPIGEPRIQDFRDGDQDASNRAHFRYGGVSLTADADIGSLRFVSLSAVRRMDARYGTDLDQGPLPLVSALAIADQRQLSQEFQLHSSDSSRIRWVAGLYYIRIEERYDPTIFRFGGSYAADRGGRIFQTLSDTGKVSSLAGYGQATVPIGQATSLSLGLRYTIEKRSVRARGEQLFDNPPLVRPIPGLPLLTEAPLESDVTDRELTWRASLDRHFSGEVMGYVAVSRGFQSGGWNLQTPQNPPFGPERLDAFEAGVKYAGRSGRLSGEASIFLYDHSDLQVTAITPIGSMTTNATSAEILGLEVQLQARFDRRTEFSFGAQLLETRYRRFPNATCTDYDTDAPVLYLPISCDVTGNRLPFAPRLKLNLGGQRQIPLGRLGTLLLSGNLAYSSSTVSEPDNVVEEAAFATIDASAEWIPDRPWPSLRLWALNLIDTRYHDSLVTFPTGGVLQRPAPPRRVGASIFYSL